MGLALSVSSIFIGCGGGGSSVGSGSGTTTTTTPDMGTLTFVDDSYQYKLKNAASGLQLGIQGQSQTAGASAIQASDDGQNDQLWHFMPMNYASSQFNVENLLTHQVLGISTASTSSGAQTLQWPDNGTNDHLWQFYKLTDGNYLIENVNSGLYLTDSNSGTTTSATIDQEGRATTGTGCTCQEWALTSTGSSPYPAPLTVTGDGIYVHDPYMLKDSSGTYWLYGTHNTLAKSSDMQTWTSQGADMNVEPSWWTTIFQPSSGAPDMWAPSLIMANGIYYQYYAVPVEPDTAGGEAVIALATSTNPAGPWADQGIQIRSWSNSTTPQGGFTGNTTYNAIDPAPFVDADGNWWMTFGSWFDGIHIVQLDPATGLPQSSAPSSWPVIASRPAGEEGSFIYYWNGWYYYFAPINACCSATSPYRIITGRSQNPNGPYLDRGGVDLKDGGGTILLSSHGNIVGPGGQSVFTDTVNGTSTPTLVYHYYDGNNSGTPTLGINRLGFTSDAWPYVE
jgi:arabinan endo-1,5-alpha-L-arabinosidase